MTRIGKGYSSNKAVYTVTYSDMGGIDLSSPPSPSSQKKRFSYLENMYRDYERGGRLESIPGFRFITDLGACVHSLFCHKDSSGEEYVVAHAGDGLYRFKLSERDSAPSPERIATVKDGKSRAFVSGNDLYVLDGEHITVVSETGAAERLGEGTRAPYVPTTYINGVEYQQRNLLTTSFKEKYSVVKGEYVIWGNEMLCYRITDEEKLFCAVTGVRSDYTGSTLVIPSYTDIGGKKYRVTEILDGAFIKNRSVTHLKINEGVLRIGRSAFKSCINLVTAYMPNSLAEIDKEAFSGCAKLTGLYLGRGLKKLGSGVFRSCDVLETISYYGAKSDLDSIETEFDLSALEIAEVSENTSVTVFIPSFTVADRISRVTLDGTVMDHSSVYSTQKGYFTGVLFNVDSPQKLDGATVILEGTYDEKRIRELGVDSGLSTSAKIPISGLEAVQGCTVCESFDGRIFLSGNPRLPNTVIYTERDESGRNSPLYFGAYDYFNDGVGSFPVISMLAVGDALTVFKSDDDGGGSIFYHVPKETGLSPLPKVYPAARVHSGICAVGDSISLLDDPLFISKSGIAALERAGTESERFFAVRSHNVNPRLLSEDLSGASLARWCGYLAVLCQGRIYLADSRATFRHESGDREYEWYFINGVGDYSSSRAVYYYASVGEGELLCDKERADSEYNGEVLFTEINGISYAYCERDGKKYLLSRTDERRAEDFYPATAMISVGDTLLLFGTENGHILIFNNDKRGEPPPSIAAAPDFDRKEYESVWERRIHPVYYDFNLTAPKYEIRTCRNNCGMPHLEKNTVKGSLTMKFGMEPGPGAGAGLICAVGTDKGDYRERVRIRPSPVDFSILDFSSLSLSPSGDVSLSINEKEKRWIEKEISVICRDFRSPIALESLCYAFTVKGRIKNG